MKWREFDMVIQTFMKEQGIPGASVAISRNKEILYVQGYGSAGASKRVNPESLFRIASISKPITAFAILHLCIQYNISLDTKVFGKKGILKRYKYKDKRVSSISLRHLLQHSAGWDRDIAGDVAFSRPASVARCQPESVEYNHALLAYTLMKKLQFKPGTRHAYSNMCYLVLGLVIEEVSGLSFSCYLSQVLDRWTIPGISLGGPWRAEWTSMEVEYFNNREPAVVPSLHTEYGELVPQYGGLAMGSAAAYGGLISNGSSLLQFVHTIEILLAGNGGSREDSDESVQGVLSIGDYRSLSSLIKESLSRPSYEGGLDWYGLGWDVEDKGQSWGHTGGMEGTSGILFHHASDLNWVLLFNAWAKDIDLNGVMKCAISHVPHLKLFDCNVVSIGEIGSSGREYEGGCGRILFSQDKSQAVILGADERGAHMMTLYLKDKGYMVTWINSIHHELVSTKASDSEKNVNYESLILKYVLLLSKQKKQCSDYVLILNKSKENILLLLKEKEHSGYFVDFIDSFCSSSGELRFSAVIVNFYPYYSFASKRSLHLAIKAETYVRHLKTWVKSQYIICQSVTEIGTGLFVSALLESKSHDGHDTTEPPSSSFYWVQIEPESFVTELNRKIKQNMTLTYAKFFNADGQPWVSGCWINSHATSIYHRITMSKYGFFPELAEAAADNIRLLSVSEYEDDGVIYYAGMWIANE